MIRVVIVEDILEIRLALQRIIDEHEAMDVVASYSCAEDALQYFGKISFDVALVDINLPGKSGIEMIAAAKSALPQCEFIILTVFEDNNNIFAALEAGASGYLLKNTPPAKITEAITDVYNGGSPMSGPIARKVINYFAGNNQTQVNSDLNVLSPREMEILTLLSKGFRYKEISESLFISTETVRTHIRNIYKKLCVQSGIEAVNKFLGRTKQPQ